MCVFCSGSIGISAKMNAWYDVMRYVVCSLSIPHFVCVFSSVGFVRMWSMPLEPCRPVLVRYGTLGCMCGIAETSPSLEVPIVRMSWGGASSMGEVRCIWFDSVCWRSPSMMVWCFGCFYCMIGLCCEFHL